MHRNTNLIHINTKLIHINVIYICHKRRMDEFETSPEGVALIAKSNELKEARDRELKDFDDEKRKQRQVITDKYQASLEVIESQFSQGVHASCQQGEFPDSDKVVVADLDRLTMPQLIFLVYKLYKFTSRKTGDRYHDGRQYATLSRTYVTGDVSYHKFTDEQWRQRLIQRLTEGACTECKTVCHTKDTCPIILAKECIACGKSKHLIQECTDVEALRRSVIVQKVMLMTCKSIDWRQEQISI